MHVECPEGEKSEFTRRRATSATQSLAAKQTNYTFTSRLLLHSQWHFISWSEPLCHASAVHHGKIKHIARTRTSMKEDREQNRAHIQTWWSLRNSVWQKQQKPPGDSGGSTAFCTCFVPLPETARSPSCVYSFEKKKKGGRRGRQCELLLLRLLLSPPATRGQGEVGSGC